MERERATVGERMKYIRSLLAFIGCVWKGRSGGKGGGGIDGPKEGQVECCGKEGNGKLKIGR